MSASNRPVALNAPKKPEKSLFQRFNAFVRPEAAKKAELTAMAQELMNQPAPVKNPVANGVRMAQVSEGTLKLAKDALAPLPPLDEEEAPVLSAPAPLDPVPAIVVATAATTATTTTTTTAAPVVAPVAVATDVVAATTTTATTTTTAVAAPKTIILNIEPYNPDEDSSEVTEVNDAAVAVNHVADANSEVESSSPLPPPPLAEDASEEVEVEDGLKSAVSTASTKSAKKVTINSAENTVHEISPAVSLQSQAQQDLDVMVDVNDDDLNSTMTSEEPTYSINIKKYLPVILAVVAAVVVIGIIAAVLFAPGLAPALGLAAVAGASTSIFSSTVAGMTAALTTIAAASGISAATAGLATVISIYVAGTAAVTAAVSNFVGFITRKAISPKMMSISDNSSSYFTGVNSSASSVRGGSSARVASEMASSNNDSQAANASAAAASDIAAPVLEAKAVSMPPLHVADASSLVSDVEEVRSSSARMR